MKISKKEDFSLIFMSILAKEYSDKYIPLSYVAERANFSVLFLKHIASALLKKGLVESKEGIGGGYRLSRKPKSISISEILEAITSNRIFVPCEKSSCHVKKKECACHSLWDNLSSKMSSYLKAISLAEFVNQ